MDGLSGTHNVIAAHLNGGHWSLLSTMELRVLNVFYARADNATGEAFPSVQSVADDLRCDNRNRVRTAIQGLEQKGLLVVVEVRAEKGGRGKSTVRRLAVPTPVPPIRTDTETGTYVVPVSTTYRGTPPVPVVRPETGTPVVPVPETETGTLPRGNGDTFDPETGTHAVPRTTGTTNGTTNVVGQADAGGGAEAAAEDLDGRIRRFVAGHPSLMWDRATHARVAKLVEAVGWDRARELIGEGVDAGKSFPVGWALGKAERESRSKAAAKPKAGDRPRPQANKLIFT